MHSLAISQHRTKDWANTKRELAGYLPAPPHPVAERQAFNSQSQKARGCYYLSPREGTFHQTGSRLTAANHVFLRSWMVDIHQRVVAWDQLSRGDILHTWDSALMAHWGNQAARIRKVIKMHSPPVTVRLPSTWSSELLRPGKGTKHMLNPQRLCQNCVWVSPVEVWVSSGLLQGLWVQQTWVWHKPSWRRLPLTPP